jgi:hypothetical protein
VIFFFVKCRSANDGWICNFWNQDRTKYFVLPLQNEENISSWRHSFIEEEVGDVWKLFDSQRMVKKQWLVLFTAEQHLQWNHYKIFFFSTYTQLYCTEQSTLLICHKCYIPLIKAFFLLHSYRIIYKLAIILEYEHNAYKLDHNFIDIPRKECYLKINK